MQSYTIKAHEAVKPRQCKRYIRAETQRATANEIIKNRECQKHKLKEVKEKTRTWHNRSVSMKEKNITM